VATWLLEGDCFVDQFTDDKVADPERMRIAQKVAVRHDDVITGKGAKYRHEVRVELWLKDGTRFERRVESARGSEYRFASDADVVEKFGKLASKALPPCKVEALRDAILGLDTLVDASTLGELLVR
jgi:2-methylcitrate dehydratase PrpD